LGPYPAFEDGETTYSWGQASRCSADHSRWRLTRDQACRLAVIDVPDGEHLLRREGPDPASVKQISHVEKVRNLKVIAEVFSGYRRY